MNTETIRFVSLATMASDANELCARVYAPLSDVARAALIARLDARLALNAALRSL